MVTCPFKQEVIKGARIESEHGLGRKMSIKITKDHIKEHPCYYTKGLIPMEKRLNRPKGGK